MMFGGFIEILRTFAVVQKLKKAMKGLDLKTVLAAVALLGTVCNAASQEKADGRGALAAPQVEVDANGLFTVEDCPTVYDRFNIVFHVSDYVISSADILWDGVECQTVSFDNDNDCVTRMAVHYLDANFDGYLDILLEQAPTANTAPCCCGMKKKTCSCAPLMTALSFSTETSSMSPKGRQFIAGPQAAMPRPPTR